MRKLSFNEMVVLNPLQTGRDLFSSRVLVPRYVATNDGIYRVNIAKRMMRGLPVVLGFIMGMAILVLSTIIGIGLLVYFALFKDWSLALFGVGMTLGSVYGIIKLVKIRKKVERIANDIEGELVVPWSHVKSIVVMNVRQENVGSTINPNLQTNRRLARLNY